MSTPRNAQTQTIRWQQQSLRIPRMKWFLPKI